MKNKLFKLLLVALYIIAIESCNTSGNKSALSDPLPSWNEGTSKQNIINYVQSISDEKGPDYIAPEDRIVCFDNDGTLWTEQPFPNQIYFTFWRIQELAKTDPSLATTMPYSAVVNNDTAALAKLKKEDIVALVAKADEAKVLDSFDVSVKKWFDVAKHPRYGMTFDKVTYQPMLELLEYLRSHDFQIFIVSGGSVEFMRVFADQLYGVPSQNVIGSRMKLETVRTGDSVDVQRTSEFEWNDDREGKVTSIEEFIGRKPIMVVGNSDGDLAMMEYGSEQDRKTLMMYINHTDGEREYDYSQGVLAGALIEGMKVAKAKGWTIVDMKTDWNKVFTAEK